MGNSTAVVIRQVLSGRCRPAVVLFIVLLAAAAGANAWTPVEGQMLTRWSKQVSAENPLPEYPRPQLRREQWTNLNGLWDYAVTARNSAPVLSFDGEILVPFPIESALSGVKKAVTPSESLWYRRAIEIPENWRGRQVMLHFGAVDWEATVWVNGQEQGSHRGGYTPFSFDITDALRPQARQEILVRVWDPSDTGTQPRGKQVLEPQGIWYTAVTGIWQTVWIEPVGGVSIQRLRLVPDIDRQTLTVSAALSGNAAGLTLTATVRDGGTTVAEARAEAGAAVEISLDNPKLWSPDSPHLYDLDLRLTRGAEQLDAVESYFGMRKIALAKDTDGHQRLFLNNRPLFQLGPLDQGWWPDGLYTAPTDEALAYDIEVTKQLGFNMARKHVKVEPARWYYHCDRLGLLVWQDMPSGFLGGRGPRSLFVDPWDEQDAPRDGVSAAMFEAELQEMLDAFQPVPSIVMWVPFNEGWGQYDTARISDWIRQYDPTRLVNAASGWTDRGAGDVYDTHLYPGPGLQSGGPGRAAVLGEFGGLGWPVEEHLWWDKRNWGYRTYYGRDELAGKYNKLMGDLIGPLARGMAAAIYTQTTDVEGEVNGLMTYDREVVKFDAAKLKQLHAPLYEEPRRAKFILPTSFDQPQMWSYTFNDPGEGWTDPDFSTKTWPEGNAPFRSANDSQFPNGEQWAAGPIWIRRSFRLDGPPRNLWLEIAHSVSQGAVYLNGTRISELDQRTRREYRHEDVSEFARLLRRGENVIAIQADVGDPTRESRRDLDAGLYTLE